jgi:protein-S-isoprenylcysteine O-methyltransferase Ste14
MDYRKIGNIFFKYRSYTPLPLVLMMILFIRPTTTSVLIGLIIAIAGEAIRLWAVSYAGSETRVTSGVGGTYLVTQGPYGIVRNPLYWGNIFIYLGMGVMSNALFPYLQIFALFYFLFQYYCIILSEEDFLRGKFKGVFEKYYNSVNRFMPSFGRVPEEINSKLGINFKAGFISEKRTLQSFFITMIIILFFYFTGIRIF